MSTAFTCLLTLCLTATEPVVLQERPDRLIVELPNRMIVVAQHLPTTAVVSAQIWVKTGSLYEQEHVGAGLSHFLEHLLSGGTTTNRTEADSNAMLGRIGAQTNAATSLDTVRYYINTTADHTPQAIELLSDWIGHNVVLQSEFDRERDVIQREFDMGRGDANRIFWKLTQQVYFGNDHPARHPTIGYLDRFLEITRDQIDDFYHRMYAPNNLLFVVVGDIDPPEVVEQITQLWKDAEPRELPTIHIPKAGATSPKLPGGGVGYADIQRPRVQLLWPGTQLAEPGDYELDLLAAILGQGEASRLARTVRDEQQLVTSISAYNTSFTWGAGFFGIDMEIANNADTAIAAATLQAQRLIDQPVEPDELASAKRRVLAGALLAGQSAQAVASQLAGNIIGMSDPDYLDKYAQRVQSLTADDLQRAAKKYLVRDAMRVIQLLPIDEDHPVSTFASPTDAPMPPDDAVAFDLDNAAVITRLKQNLTDTEPRKITVDEPVTMTLDNGITLIVQRSTVVPGVAVQLYTLGGLLADPPGREGLSYAMASMLDRGTTTRTAKQIHQTVEGLGASLSTAAGNNATYATARSLTEDWLTVLELLSDVVQHPTFDPDQWAKLQPRLLAALDREKNSWSGELRARFREVYFQDHPWSHSTLGRRETIEQLTADDLKAFHQNHFRGEDIVISIVGDIPKDPQQVRQQVEKFFADLPATSRCLTLPRPAPPQTTTQTFHTDKPLVAVEIGFGPGITRNHRDYAAVEVLVNVMSNFPSGWLEQELRGKGPGLVYAVGAGVRVGVVPGYLAILFNTDAQRSPEAIRRAMSVIERAKAGDFDDDTLARAKARLLTDQLLNLQTHSARAAHLALDQLYGVTDPGPEAFKQQVDAVDAAALERVAQRYLINPVTVTIAPGSRD